MLFPNKEGLRACRWVKEEQDQREENLIPSVKQ